MQDNEFNAAGAHQMRVGRLNLTVLSSALLYVGAVLATPAAALPQRPWYLAAFDHVLHLVTNSGEAAPAGTPEAAKPAAPVYVSGITKDQGTITFQGDVPSEGDLKMLQGIAAATSPGAAFADKSKLNANVPDRDVWLAGMTFALRQLGKLEHGAALLRNSSIVIQGVTKSGDDFASVQRKLRDEAPKNLSLESAVKPHYVHPFVWTAQLQLGSVSLSGYVPDRQDQPLCNHAQNLFQSLRVTNSMEFAEGEPRGWSEAAKVALDMLSLLYSGSASLSDNVIRLDGIYSSAENGPALMKAYSEKLPAGYKLEQHVLEPVARAPNARAEDVNLAAQATPAALNP
jgi:hypothetical protein